MKKALFFLSLIFAVLTSVMIAGVFEMTSTQTLVFVGISLFTGLFMTPKGVLTVQAVTPIYASEIVGALDVWKPEIMTKIFKRYGDQGLSYYMLLKSMGFEQSVAQDTFSHFEDTLINPTFKVRTGIIAPGPGADAVITLAVADLDADNRFYPRLNDVVFFANEVTGIIIDIDVSTPSAPVLTITPNSSTDDIGILATGAEISIISGAFSEGSGQPVGAVSLVEKFTGQMQIIKETISATGTELTNQTWLTLDGVEGAPLYSEAMEKMDYRFQLKCSGALLFQKPTTNTIIDPATNRPIKTTEGLIPYIRRAGNPTPYTAGTLTVADFDAIDRTLDREFAGNYILAGLGIALHQEIDNLLKAYFNNTNIIFARQMVNDAIFNKNESLGASVNFSYLTKSERTYCFKRMGDFSNRNTYGTQDSKTPEMGMFLPINKKKDPVNTEMVPSIGMRYKAKGNYNRRTEIWKVQGAGPGLKVTDIDTTNTYIRGDIGAQHRGGNQMVLLHT